MEPWLEADAVMSACGRYRYALRRRWRKGRGELLVVGLNPSRADARFDDPTLRRCIGFAQRWGFQGLRLANLFAWRARDPAQLLRVHDPIGPDNDHWLQQLADGADLVLAAWGTKGDWLNRAESVRVQLGPWHCLGLSRQGAPLHPLYLPRERQPQLGG